MSIDDPDAALRIVEAGRRRVHTRLQDAFAQQIAGHAELAEIDPDVLERLVSESADRAGASLWRISLAEGAADEFGVGVDEALAHPAVHAAEQLIGPPAEPLPVPADAGLPAEALGPDADEPTPAAWEDTEPAPDAVDPWPDAAADELEEPAAAEPPPLPPEPEPAPEVRIAAVHTGGIDSLQEDDDDLQLRLTDAGLDVIRASTNVAIGRLEWGGITSVELTSPRRGLRRRIPALEVHTGLGQATFDLPGLSDEQAAERLAPMLDRLRAAGLLAA